MNQEQMREQIIRIFADIAPEVEEIEIQDDLNLQEQLDLDSIDMMNYIVKVGENFGQEIPNSEYKNFLTIKGAMDYLTSKH